MEMLACLTQGVIRVGSLAGGEFGEVAAATAADGVGVLGEEGGVVISWAATHQGNPHSST